MVGRIQPEGRKLPTPGLNASGGCEAAVTVSPIKSKNWLGKIQRMWRAVAWK